MKYFFQSISWNTYFAIVSSCKLPRNFHDILFEPLQAPEVFCQKGVLKYFAKFTGKHQCQSLFFNKVAGLRCVFACEFEVFWVVQSRGALNKIRCSFKILHFCVGYWRDLDYNWRANSKHPGKLGILVKIYIFSWDNTMVFLCGICLLPEKMTLFFSILNK